MGATWTWQVLVNFGLSLHRFILFAHGKHVCSEPAIDWPAARCCTVAQTVMLISNQGFPYCFTLMISQGQSIEEINSLDMLSWRPSSRGGSIVISMASRAKTFSSWFCMERHIQWGTGRKPSSPSLNVLFTTVKSIIMFTLSKLWKFFMHVSHNLYSCLHLYTSMIKENLGWWICKLLVIVVQTLLTTSKQKKE